jgi:hypothetical protein
MKLLPELNLFPLIINRNQTQPLSKNNDYTRKAALIHGVSTATVQKVRKAIVFG